jgi:hypothetical protein
VSFINNWSSIETEYFLNVFFLLLSLSFLHYFLLSSRHRLMPVPTVLPSLCPFGLCSDASFGGPPFCILLRWLTFFYNKLILIQFITSIRIKLTFSSCTLEDYSIPIKMLIFAASVLLAFICFSVQDSLPYKRMQTAKVYPSKYPIYYPTHSLNVTHCTI